MYKVVLVSGTCGQDVLDVGLIEKNANEMAKKGYELVEMYETRTTECRGTKTAAVMVFKSR